MEPMTLVLIGYFSPPVELLCLNVNLDERHIIGRIHQKPSTNMHINVVTFHTDVPIPAYLFCNTCCGET